MPPKTILLMRHAEKPDDSDDHHLTAEGHERAERLARFIPAHFGKPDFIFAASGKHSRRSVETVEPLAAATSTAIDPSYDADAFSSLATALLHEPVYDGKFVVICWRHTVILDLAQKLNADAGDHLVKWPGGTFDLILWFTFSVQGVPKVLQVLEPF